MKLLREPLFHFLLLGGVLFAAFSMVGAGEAEAGDRIVVTRGRIEHLASTFARTWQRPPTPRELQGLVHEFVREEVLYREALALGLDRDDTVIRRRLAQKLEFLAEDFVEPAEPSDADLQAYLDEHPDSFRVEGEVTFRHVYLSPDRRGDALAADVERILAELNGSAGDAEPEAAGDPFLLPHRYEAATESEIRSIFGGEFAARLTGVEPGRWHGPIESGYGVHLVRVLERTGGRLPPLREVRAAVQREWEAARRRDAKEAFYRGLRDGYEVVVEDFGEGLEDDLSEARK